MPARDEPQDQRDAESRVRPAGTDSAQTGSWAAQYARFGAALDEATSIESIAQATGALLLPAIADFCALVHSQPSESSPLVAASSEGARRALLVARREVWSAVQDCPAPADWQFTVRERDCLVVELKREIPSPAAPHAPLALLAALAAAGCSQLALRRLRLRDRELGLLLAGTIGKRRFDPESVLWLTDTGARLSTLLGLLAEQNRLEEMRRELRRISHDLRTPLVPILSSMHVLQQDGRIPNDLSRYFTVVMRNVEAENAISERLLDLAKPLGRGVKAAAEYVPRSPESRLEPSRTALFTPTDPTEVRTLPARILLVDDHEDTLIVTRLLLERRGYNVETATTAHSALALIDDRAFDLLIADIGLPDEDGIELMRRIKEKRPLSAIALSGYGREADIQHCLEAGFAAHFTKPVDIELLDDAIRSLVSRRATTEASS